MIARATQNLVEKFDGELAEGDRLVIDAGDTAVVVGDGGLTALGPGMHTLADATGEVFFVSQVTRRWQAEGTPTFADDEGEELTLTVTLDYAVRVVDASRFIAAIGDAELDGDEGIKDWIAMQLVGLAAGAFASDPEVDASVLADALLEHIREPFATIGLEITSIDDVALTAA